MRDLVQVLVVLAIMTVGFCIGHLFFVRRSEPLTPPVKSVESVDKDKSGKAERCPFCGVVGVRVTE